MLETPRQDVSLIKAESVQKDKMSFINEMKKKGFEFSESGSKKDKNS